MKKSKQYVLKIVGCMMLVMVCALIVFSYQDFPARLMAAILGVVITATITVVLLDGQSKKEQTAKRNSKVFEEKLKIYQDFLTTLYDVVKDRKLTEDEKLLLEFKTSLVAMHCKPKNLDSVSAAVRNVISSVCPSDEEKKQKSQGNIPLLKSLLDVVEALKIDLYNVDTEKDGKKDDNDLDKMLFSSTIKTNTINNFQKAYVETADEENAESKDTWSQAVKKWQTLRRIGTIPGLITRRFSKISAVCNPVACRICRLPLFADLLHQPLGAGVQTPGKPAALRMIAGDFAPPAMQASFLPHQHPAPGIQPLRIVAPYTSQRASAQKHRGAHTGAVIGGKLFDIKDKSFCHSVYSCRAIT